MQLCMKDGKKSPWLGSKNQQVTKKLKVPGDLCQIRVNVFNSTYVNYIGFISPNSKLAQVKHDISGTWSQFNLSPTSRITGVYGASFARHDTELLQSLGFIIETS